MSFQIVDLQYSSGQKGILRHTDGSGFAYYSTGEKAVCVTSVNGGRRFSAVIFGKGGDGGEEGVSSKPGRVVLGALDDWGKGIVENDRDLEASGPGGGADGASRRSIGPSKSDPTEEGGSSTTVDVYPLDCTSGPGRPAGNTNKALFGKNAGAQKKGATRGSTPTPTPVSVHIQYVFALGEAASLGGGAMGTEDAAEADRPPVGLVFRMPVAPLLERGPGGEHGSLSLSLNRPSPVRLKRIGGSLKGGKSSGDKKNKTDSELELGRGGTEAHGGSGEVGEPQNFAETISRLQTLTSNRVDFENLQELRLELSNRNPALIRKTTIQKWSGKYSKSPTFKPPVEQPQKIPLLSSDVSKAGKQAALLKEIDELTGSPTLLVVVVTAIYNRNQSLAAISLADRVQGRLVSEYGAEEPEEQKTSAGSGGISAAAKMGSRPLRPVTSCPFRLVRVELSEGKTMAQRFGLRDCPFCLMFYMGKAVYANHFGDRVLRQLGVPFELALSPEDAAQRVSRSSFGALLIEVRSPSDGPDLLRGDGKEHRGFEAELDRARRLADAAKRFARQSDSCIRDPKILCFVAASPPSAAVTSGRRASGPRDAADGPRDPNVEGSGWEFADAVVPSPLRKAALGTVLEHFRLNMPKECKLKYKDRSYAGRLKIVSSFEDHLKQQPSAAPKVVASAFKSGLESFPDLHNLIVELSDRDSYEYLKTKILKASGEKEEKRLFDAFHSLATLSSS
uniref:Uncharacterized protein n=1 Tax=Chromera velia CCMP2878 TaxID=1169474 RepID=A0A0G4FZA0_9ALVE|eukprot:Cvel_19513.t1-p1 / transcript=Cvel_19513.t1 / gene=Cvel_19513 / organism=Chromera_velia_CCMP2878 / gene_product=hypothetical protein / transcript_product=hypothetical protein / location=Cvel_scaffold1688:27032-37110(-) / protein_length=732 / sequence_SO=supercontig / SO=protein_coding / is_pseudo=false